MHTSVELIQDGIDLIKTAYDGLITTGGVIVDSKANQKTKRCVVSRSRPRFCNAGPATDTHIMYAAVVGTSIPSSRQASAVRSNAGHNAAGMRPHVRSWGLDRFVARSGEDVDIVEKSGDSGRFSFSSQAWRQVEAFRQAIIESRSPDIGFSLLGADSKPPFGADTTHLQRSFIALQVYVIEMLESWAAGGGVHCHTNDMPAIGEND